MKSLEALQFENSYSRLPEEFYDPVTPLPLRNSHLVSFNPDAAALIDLGADEHQRDEFLHYFSGQRQLPGMTPVAMCYSGHQFGAYVPRLGDGRAVLLGQVKNQTGEKWDLHLKGCGPTLYSRGGDGRAVLRSSIREYLCSEAMHGLGIPTTRALCLIGSEEPVYREKAEPGAMVVRMAPSHVRFGSFEYFYHTNQHQHLKTLADHVINEYMPELSGQSNLYIAMFDEAIYRTANLIAQWQGVGFAHGVMNSDNMSILGLTLDYGPFGFLDTFDHGYICNHSDYDGRYAFDQQPDIGYFNLTCLAQGLLPLFAEDKEESLTIARKSLGRYPRFFREAYQKVFRAKLGLQYGCNDDDELWRDLLGLLNKQADYTNFFRALCNFDSRPGVKNEALRDMLIDRDAFDAWAERYRQRLQLEQSNDQERAARMKQVNPKYILRNYMAETAIRRAEDERDYSEVNRLLELLRNPFDEQPETERYAAPAPDWAQSISVSCSS